MFSIQSVTSIFSFSHNVFYSIKEKLHHLNLFDLKLLYANGLDLDKAVSLSTGKALTFYGTTNFFTLSNLTTFADDKINVTKKLKFVLGRVENIVGKGENAGHQHFYLFP